MSELEILTAAEAAVRMKVARPIVDAACLSGALFAVDQTPQSTRRSWRIDTGALLDWHRAGRPINPKSTAA